MSASTKTLLLCLHIFPISVYLLVLLHQAIFVVSSTTHNYRNVLSVKTTYNNSFDEHESKVIHGLPLHPTISKLCRPIQFNGIYRHGIRNPGNKDIDKIQTFYDRVVNALNNSNIHTTLQLPFKADSAKQLSERGAIELQSIQKRVVKRFDSLLSDAEPDQLEFISSSLRRAIASRDAFSSAFEQLKINVPTTNRISDDLLRFYTACKQYMPAHESSTRSKYHFDKFWSKSNVEKVAHNVREKLGVENMEVAAEDLHAIYAYGATEEATFGQSQWLKLLDHGGLKMLEYANDLKKYWKKAYGDKVNYEQSCPLLSEIFHRMDDVINGNSDKKGIFRFGHHGTVVRLLGLLGLFKDEEPLMADNYERHANRKFRNSRIGPFSTNIAFVLYECSPGVTTVGDNNDDVHLPPTLDRYMVELLFKEIPERFPFCSYDLCSYDKVRNHYKRHIDLCDLKHVCSRHDEL